MKGLALLFVALGLVSLPSVDAQTISQKLQFKNTFVNKDLVDKIRNKTSLWKTFDSDKNPFFNRTDSELKGLLGLKGDPEAEAKSGRLLQVISNTTTSGIPATFDART